ncbi:unnamed protein product [Blepharisma stoltei]|uniref:Secreted protein n=1 Tax=Blepharisma stoltei TaxID=1481888 RepID=A0AAU9JRK9_9CILI|nr:unnamed protein product [Blepharisma stoltei]
MNIRSKKKIYFIFIYNLNHLLFTFNTSCTRASCISVVLTQPVFTRAFLYKPCTSASCIKTLLAHSAFTRALCNLAPTHHESTYPAFTTNSVSNLALAHHVSKLY